MAKKGEVIIDEEKVSVKELTAGQRRDLINKAKENEDDACLNAQMIKDGCEKYSDKSIDDILALPGSDFDALARKISELSGMGEEAEKKA